MKRCDVTWDWKYDWDLWYGVRWLGANGFARVTYVTWLCHVQTALSHGLSRCVVHGRVRPGWQFLLNNRRRLIAVRCDYKNKYQSMTLNTFNIWNFNGFNLICSYTGTLPGKDFNLFVLETWVLMRYPGSSWVIQFSNYLFILWCVSRLGSSLFVLWFRLFTKNHKNSKHPSFFLYILFLGKLLGYLLHRESGGVEQAEYQRSAALK